MGVGAALVLGGMYYRQFTLNSEGMEIDFWFYCGLGAMTVGYMVVGLGYDQLLAANVNTTETQGIGTILTVLSILTSGAFVGYFSIERQKQAEDERTIVFILESLTTLLLVGLLGAIAFYLPYVMKDGDLLLPSWVFSFLFTGLLVVFGVYSYWDGRR
jgi:hypothetical protein